MNILTWSLTLIAAIYAVLMVIGVMNEGSVANTFDNFGKKTSSLLLMLVSFYVLLIGYSVFSSHEKSSITQIYVVGSLVMGHMLLQFMGWGNKNDVLPFTNDVTDFSETYFDKLSTPIGLASLLLLAIAKTKVWSCDNLNSVEEGVEMLVHNALTSTNKEFITIEKSMYQRKWTIVTIISAVLSGTGLYYFFRARRFISNFEKKNEAHYSSINQKKDEKTRELEEDPGYAGYKKRMLKRMASRHVENETREKYQTLKKWKVDATYTLLTVLSFVSIVMSFTMTKLRFAYNGVDNMDWRVFDAFKDDLKHTIMFIALAGISLLVLYMGKLVTPAVLTLAAHGAVAFGLSLVASIILKEFGIIRCGLVHNILYVLKNMREMLASLFSQGLGFSKLVIALIAVQALVLFILISPPDLSSYFKVLYGSVPIMKHTVDASLVHKSNTIEEEDGLYKNDYSDYNYAVSSWVMVDSLNNQYEDKTKSKLYDFGGKPTVYYDSNNNCLDIMCNTDVVSEEQEETIKEPVLIHRIEQFPLQKWHHIVVNVSETGAVDVFVNNKHVASKTDIIVSKDFGLITVGDKDGVSGGVSNVDFYNAPLSTSWIHLLYHVQGLFL